DERAGVFEGSALGRVRETADGDLLHHRERHGAHSRRAGGGGGRIHHEAVRPGDHRGEVLSGRPAVNGGRARSAGCLRRRVFVAQGVCGFECQCRASGLKVKQMSMSALGAAKGKGNTPPPNHVRVMVVDDSAVIRGILSRWLEDDPLIRVETTAHNGVAAVRQAQIQRYDVIVLDIEMPEMDGLTALPQLLAAQPGVQVIMASTLTLRNADISLKALSLGAADYIPKPQSTG